MDLIEETDLTIQDKRKKNIDLNKKKIKRHPGVEKRIEKQIEKKRSSSWILLFEIRG